MAFKILLPIDGTELSLQQTRFAIQLMLNGLKAHYVVANVQEPASFYELITLRNAATVKQISARAARDIVAPAVQLLEAAGVPHDVRITEEGDAVQGMLDLIESEQCDMVIIGAHDRKLLESGGMRSSAQRLARVAPVPVLSVPAPGSRKSA
jgi:nucleotide-binding universal stress UspA family protein